MHRSIKTGTALMNGTRHSILQKQRAPTRSFNRMLFIALAFNGRAFVSGDQMSDRKLLESSNYGDMSNEELYQFIDAAGQATDIESRMYDCFQCLLNCKYKKVCTRLAKISASSIPTCDEDASDRIIDLLNQWGSDEEAASEYYEDDKAAAEFYEDAEAEYKYYYDKEVEVEKSVEESEE
eukprot:gene4328-14439_t